jgi:polar amino acid transport system permease protein
VNDLGNLPEYLTSEAFLRGAGITLLLTVVSMVLGIVGGFLLAVLKQSRLGPARWLAHGYIWLFRGTPVLLQLIFVFAALPQMGIRFSPIVCAIIALALNEAAYMAEIVRSGVQSVAQGQRTAARMLGMRDWQIMRYVILPQAARVALPPTGNQFIGMLKTSALASVVAVQDLLLVAQRNAAASFDYVATLVAAAIYYLVLTTLFTFLLDRVERRLDPRGRAVAAARKRSRARPGVPVAAAAGHIPGGTEDAR